MNTHDYLIFNFIALIRNEFIISFFPLFSAYKVEKLKWMAMQKIHLNAITIIALYSFNNNTFFYSLFLEFATRCSSGA